MSLEKTGSKILTAFPGEMKKQIDYIAHAEHRTRSDLIREAMRRYIDNFRRQSSIAPAVHSPPEVVA